MADSHPQTPTILKVVCAGDSITGASNLRFYLKYSHLLELMLEARRGENRSAVVNRGIAGDTTAGLLQRLSADVLAEHPDIVVLLIGGNDASPTSGLSPETTRANLQQIVASIRQAGIRVLMLQYHLVPSVEQPEKAWTHLQNNNQAIGEISAEQQVPLLDMNAPMRAAAHTCEVAELVNPSDGVHLNPGGELVFARAIFSKLSALGWIPQ